MAEFFDNYAPYVAQINSGLHSQAVEDGLKLLSEAKRFAPTEYERTPKGTPFYLLAIASFLSHDYQIATFLFDAAVSEDLKHYPAKHDQPALLFMRLDDKNVNQAALPIVRRVVAKIEAVITDYDARPGRRSITIDDVRTHFLAWVLAANQPHLRTLTTTFVSFFLEWDYRLDLIDLSEAGSREPFFMHLFRGCLLFESLLKENPTKRPTKKTLGSILKNNLYRELGISRSSYTGSPSFNTIVQSITSGQSLGAAIACTAQTRNTLAHNLVWVAQSMNAEKYNLLAANIAASCLHAISCLYR
jgi:hypothetical protein